MARASCRTKLLQGTVITSLSKVFPVQLISLWFVATFPSAARLISGVAAFTTLPPLLTLIVSLYGRALTPASGQDCV